ncbi:hypothetical protein N9A28_10020 [Sulfurimonas sp.]|nr:hypothetical protein [Sulfurimonas sp.]
MNNPFESGHIKNYLLLYASVVVIMILFFIASTLFFEVKEVDKKVFVSDLQTKLHVEVVEPQKEEVKESKFKLLDKAY